MDELIKIIKDERKHFRKNYPPCSNLPDVRVDFKQFPSPYIANRAKEPVYYEEELNPFNMDDINKIRAWLEYLYTAIRRKRTVKVERMTDDEVVATYVKSKNTYIVFIINTIKHKLIIRLTRQASEQCKEDNNEILS